MNAKPLLLSLPALLVVLACHDAAPGGPVGPVRASISDCTAGEQDELYGDHLYDDADGVIHAGEYHVAISGASTSANMYYLPYSPSYPGKERWGGVSEQNANSSSQTEHHDTDGDGLANSTVCEQHILPNGVYDVQFWRTGGGAPTFYRTVAMLDRHGVAVNIPGSGVWQDVVIPFDIATGAPSMSGWFGSNTTYTFVSGTGAELGQFSTTNRTVTSGDTVWFVSTYLASGSPSRPWYGQANSVLNSFNFDYLRNPNSFGPATNSFPLDNNGIPLAHVFAAPGTSNAFNVRLRTILPYHLGTTGDPGILVGQTLTVTVNGSPVDFSTSANPTANQPVTFTAASMSGDAFFEYSWNYGDGTSTGWSPAYRQVQHTYATGGQKSVTLSVRNGSGEGPTVSKTNQISVASPLNVNLTGPDSITASGTYTWTANASGGTGIYSYQWYYKPTTLSEQAVGTNSSQYSRSVTYGSPGYFRIRVVVTSGTSSLSRFLWVSNGQQAP